VTLATRRFKVNPETITFCLKIVEPCILVRVSRPHGCVKYQKAIAEEAQLTIIGQQMIVQSTGILYH